ncbi:SMODS domain-containing nucleotidyltransferase [Bradyrhizobium sp. CCBAU 11430]|uniref:SMODS domain-containing nucleotidyltransferase n=1 Tax=Bradyrhizobium sp. CCBAU 11430 TaxID=1630881 RepID=UPI0023062EFC|nr:hypothetical protein [Bradyrhizobium sp. CCBAU 11430]
MTVGVSSLSVSERFKQFLDNITRSTAQIDDGKTKRASVCKVLNIKYWSSSSETDNSFYVGSWGKYTRIRPPRDVDVLFKLPKSVYDRFQLRTGNKQSQLLQEVKDALKASFPKTDVRGDGPVIKVPFASYAVELVPAFPLTTGKYYIPLTTNGGSYKEFDPDAEYKAVADSNKTTNENTRELIRMMKCWQGYCSVPLKSFWIEIMAVDFLSSWENAGKSRTYYDWMVRDFLKYLVGKVNSYIWVPGTYELIWIGDAWKSRTDSAYARAVKACEYESNNDSVMAGIEWQKIFGNDMPLI